MTLVREFYTDSLARNGHRRIDSFRCLRGSWTLRLDNILRRLKERAGFGHVVRFPLDDASFAQATALKGVIEETEAEFVEWTSFICDEEIVFAFRRDADAVKFRLLWD